MQRRRTFIFNRVTGARFTLCRCFGGEHLTRYLLRRPLYACTHAAPAHPDCTASPVGKAWACANSAHVLLAPMLALLHAPCTHHAPCTYHARDAHPTRMRHACSSTAHRERTSVSTTPYLPTPDHTHGPVPRHVCLDHDRLIHTSRYTRLTVRPQVLHWVINLMTTEGTPACTTLAYRRSSYQC